MLEKGREEEGKGEKERGGQGRGSIVSKLNTLVIRKPYHINYFSHFLKKSLKTSLISIAKMCIS